MPEKEVKRPHVLQPAFTRRSGKVHTIGVGQTIALLSGGPHASWCGCASAPDDDLANLRQPAVFKLSVYPRFALLRPKNTNTITDTKIVSSQPCAWTAA